METMVASAGSFGGGCSRRSDWVLPRNRYYRPEEMGKILAAAKTLPDERIHFLLYCLANLGSRISETLQIRAKDIHATEPIVRLITLKQRTPRTREIRVPESVAEHLRVWVAMHNIPPDGFLFPSHRPERLLEGKPLTRQWGLRMFDLAAVAAHLKVWRKGTKPGIGPHGFRHGAAISFMEQSKAMPNLSALEALKLLADRLGHADLRMSLTYLHAVSEREMVAHLKPIGE